MEKLMRTELSQAVDRLKLTIAMLGEYDYVLNDLLDGVETLLNDLHTAPPSATISDFMTHTDSVVELAAALEQVKGFRYFDPDSSGQLSLFDE
jgi:hypothetical protein